MKKKILVVDDSRAMRAYVRGALTTASDCEVDEAASGFEALRLLPRSTYDIVITDINMPDINGLELIRFIRMSERHQSVPIVIISTQSSQRDEDRAVELGADSFLPKPFRPEEIADMVADHLSGRASQP